MLKWIKRTLLIAIVMPLVGVAVWYGSSFLPYVSQIKEVLEKSNKDAQPVIDSLYIYAIAAGTEKEIRYWAVRQAYSSLSYSENRTKSIYWHADNILWYFASHLHFNNEEIFGLWLSCAISECGKGFHAAARKYYGKELAELSQRELLGLVAMVKSPSIFKPGSESSEKQIELILRNM